MTRFLFEKCRRRDQRHFIIASGILVGPLVTSLSPAPSPMARVTHGLQHPSRPLPTSLSLPREPGAENAQRAPSVLPRKVVAGTARFRSQLLLPPPQGVSSVAMALVPQSQNRHDRTLDGGFLGPGGQRRTWPRSSAGQLGEPPRKAQGNADSLEFLSAEGAEGRTRCLQPIPDRPEENLVSIPRSGSGVRAEWMSGFRLVL